MGATVRGIKVEDRSASFSFDDREFSVTYLVTTTADTVGPREVREAFGIPRIGDTYQPTGSEFDPAAVVTNIDVDQTDSPREWEVEVRFSTLSDSDITGVGNPGDNPLNKPAVRRITFAERQIVPAGYYSNPAAPPADGRWENAILAPNGEPFSPQPTVPVSDLVLQVTKNVGGVITPASLWTINNTVNSVGFAGADERQLRLVIGAADERWHASIGPYIELTYSLIYRYETWDIQILNQGSYYWENGKPADVSTTEGKVETDESGNPIFVNLTSQGKLNTTNTPSFTVIEWFRKIDFNGLGIL